MAGQVASEIHDGLRELTGQDVGEAESLCFAVVLEDLRSIDGGNRRVEQPAPLLHVVEAARLQRVGVKLHSQILSNRLDVRALVDAGEIGKYAGECRERVARDASVAWGGKRGNRRRIDPSAQG